MIMKNDWILLGLVLCSSIGVWLMLPTLPAQIPMHWNIEGQIDRYGTQSEFMMLSLVPLGLMIMFIVLPYLDPKRANYKKHSKAYTATKYVVTLLMIAMSWITILYLKGLVQSVDTFVILGIGITFIIMGNYMPQIRHNYFFGIKTPWTLADEVVWTKTHRIGGALFMVFGLALLPTAFFFKTGAPYIVLAGALLTSLGSVIYSFVIFHRRQGSKMTEDKNQDAD